VTSELRAARCGAGEITMHARCRSSVEACMSLSLADACVFREGSTQRAHLIGSALQTMSFALSFVVARGGPRRGMGGGPVHHAGLNKLERLAGPSVPSSATPQLAFDLAPCILLHAEQRSCAHLSSSSPLASARGSPYTIETGSSLAIGPS
jgi:hypothetical protein